MKKIVLCTIIFTTVISSSFFTEQLIAIGNKSIIFDLEGVLVEPDPTAALAEMGSGGVLALGGSLGLSGIFRSAFRKTSPTKELIEQFFKAIEPIKYVGLDQSEQKSLDTLELSYKGHLAPRLIKQWLIESKVKSTIIEQHAIDNLKNQNLPFHQITLATKFSSMTFNPKTNARTVKVIAEALELIKELKRYNNDLYIIAHWNREAIDSMKEEYPDLFNLIGDSIITSAEAKLIKPELYNHSIDEFKLDLQNSFFVESEQINLDHVLTLGSNDKKPQGIVCKQNYNEIRTALQKFDALPIERK